ncbi:MAG: ABC transporter substrate-binding protein [Synergistaceae bacterium]|jgi:iron(III) transport system substrate-binding protein|nr:ABC transporter substrate-binding protein [Synergistaceae bacterium]
MRKISFFIRRILPVCVLALLVCTPALAAPAPLVLYTSQIDEDVEGLLGAFKAKHPDIEVVVFRSGTEEVISKVMAEKMTGEVKADVLLLADSVTFDALKTQGLLEPYRSPELSAIPAKFADKDGMYCGTKVLATVLIYNTNKVKAAPDSWKIMTDASAKGNTFIASPLYSGAAAYQLGVLVRSEGFGWKYYEDLKAAGVSVGRGNGSVVTAIAGGEKAYGLVVDYMALRAKKQGSPVDFAYPKEGVTTVTEPIAIVKKENINPDAKTFVDFVLSEDGQKLVVTQDYAPVRNGIAAPEGLRSASELKILDFDPALLAKEREADKKKFAEIFQ